MLNLKSLNLNPPMKFAAGLVVLALACSLPAAPQTMADGPGVTVDTGGAMMHRTSVFYPEAARSAKIQGTVTLEVTLENSGSVAESRVLGGPVELRRAAQQSVLQWHFAMDSGSNTRQVKIQFQLPAEAASRSGMAQASRIARPAPLTGKRIAQISISGASDALRADLLSRLPVHEGDTVADDTMDKVRAIAQSVDEHINVGFGLTPSGEARIILSLPGGSAVPAPADGVKRITIGGNVQQAKLLSQPKPVYPPDAKAARIQGVVNLAAIIAKDGTVANLTLMSGHPLLIASALDAVRQWTYEVTLLNGEPVEVQTQITVNYTLSQ
jgi:TonB family protein